MKRIDLAINDMAGILDIPELTEKCNHEECISVFRSFKSYRSGELVKSREQDRYDIPIKDTTIKNRFEIRLKNGRTLSALIVGV